MSGVRFPAEILATASKPALGPTHSRIQRAPGTFFPWVKRPGRETYHLPPSSAEVKDARSYISILPYVFMSRYLVNYRKNFNLLTQYFIRVIE